MTPRCHGYIIGHRNNDSQDTFPRIEMGNPGKILVREEVVGTSETLGFDPLYVANEGKLVTIVSGEDADKVLRSMQGYHYGKDAAIIGEVRTEHPGRVAMKTFLGSSRLVDMLVGDILPRIC